MYYGYPHKCDACGRFHAMTEGASWIAIPATDIPGEYGDERTRCKSCTENHGGFYVDPKRYKREMVSGIITKEN